MAQTQQREQKWGFWLYMLNFFTLDSLGRLLIRKALHTDEIQFTHHLLSFGIALTLTIGISYALRSRPWKYSVWATVAIVGGWLIANILFAVN
ncbi:hypothetical protein ACWKW6_32365 [Dyadobacter jiangsuensis]